MFGDQTNLTLVAPSDEKISFMWRHAATKSAGTLALTVPPHGYQLPFISCSGRRRTVPPNSFAPRRSCEERVPAAVSYPCSA